MSRRWSGLLCKWVVLLFLLHVHEHARALLFCTLHHVRIHLCDKSCKHIREGDCANIDKNPFTRCENSPKTFGKVRTQIWARIVLRGVGNHSKTQGKMSAQIQARTLFRSVRNHKGRWVRKYRQEPDIGVRKHPKTIGKVSAQIGTTHFIWSCVLFHSSNTNCYRLLSVRSVMDVYSTLTSRTVVRSRVAPGKCQNCGPTGDEKCDAKRQRPRCQEGRHLYIQRPQAIVRHLNRARESRSPVRFAGFCTPLFPEHCPQVKTIHFSRRGMVYWCVVLCIVKKKAHMEKHAVPYWVKHCPLVAG